MCYTSGTTGRPKGVVYSHRAIALHTLASALHGSLGSRERDDVLPVVPMFHANAWGFPFSRTMVGAKQVFPGPHLDPASLLEASSQRAGDDHRRCADDLDRHPAGARREPRRAATSRACGDDRRRSGGAAGADRGFEQRHGLTIMHAWGMTEMSPLGTVSRLPAREAGAAEDEQYATARSRACRRRSSRSARAAPTASCRGTARRWASSRCADPGSRRRTTTARGRPTGGPRTAGSGPATSSRSSRTATSRSRIARRISIKSGGEWI